MVLHVGQVPMLVSNKHDSPDYMNSLGSVAIALLHIHLSIFKIKYLVIRLQFKHVFIYI